MRMSHRLVVLFVVLAVSALSACGTAPTDESLRESFVRQLSANRFVRDVRRDGGEVRFTAPGADGEDQAAWRVRIDAAIVEPQQDATRPYRGVVRSSWFSNERPVVASGGESHLPLPLTSNGLAQECWALWEQPAGQWTWE